MFVIFILELFLIHRSQAQTCKNISISPNQLYYSFQSNSMILEGDDEHMQNVLSYNMDVIKKKFSIPYHQNFIALQIIDPNYIKNKITNKLICQLFKQNDYSIICIESNQIYFDEIFQYKEVIYIETRNVSQDYCDYMNFDEIRQTFILFCNNNHNFKIYEVNIQNQTKLLLQQDLTIQFQEQCKRSQFKLFDQRIIISYYNCTHWMILQTSETKEDTQILYDYSSVLIKKVLQDFQIVNEVQFCENKSFINIYLLARNRYAIIQISKIDGLTYSSINYTTSNYFLKLIIGNKCSYIIPITYNQQYSENTQQVEQTEFVLHELYEFNDINYFQNYLLLKTQTQLIIDITKQINQTYSIESTPLIFLNQYNLFYQIDIPNNAIQFYRMLPIKKIIKPTKKYIFEIDFKNVFGNSDNFHCFQLDKLDNDEKIYDIKSTFNCEMQAKCKIQIGLENSLQFFDFDATSSKTNQLSIDIKRIRFEDPKCVIKNLTNSSNYKFYTFSRIEQHNLIYQMNNQLYFYNCLQKRIVLIISLLSQQVYDYLSHIFIYDQNTNTGKLLFCRNEMIQQYKIKFDHKISKIKQFQQFLLLYADNKILTMNLNYSPQNLINDIQSYIKQLQQNIPKESQVLFYTNSPQLQIIQHSGIIVLKTQNITSFYQFPEFPIIYVFNLVNQLYFIFAIHYETNSILRYAFDDGEILLLQNWTNLEYIFTNPLQYKTSINQFCILTEKNKSLYILIFSFTQNQFLLDQVIQTNNSFFAIEKNFLLLYNPQQGVILRNLLEYDVEIQVNQFSKNQLILKDQTTITFQPSYLNELYHFDLKIQIINECRNLHTFFNSTQIQYQNLNNIQLKVNTYFKGPIDQLSYRMNSNKLMNLSPINYISSFYDCHSLNQINCKRNLQIDLDQLGNAKYYQIIIVDEKNKIVIKSLLYNQAALIWLDQQNFLVLKDINNTLQGFEYYLDQNNNLKQTKKHEIDFEIQSIIDIKNFKREENLIQIITNQQQYFFFVNNGQFGEIKGFNNVIDFICIGNKKDQYLLLQQIQTTFDYVINIITFRQNEKVILSQINITQSLIQEMRKKFDNEFSFSNKSVFHSMQLASSQSINDMITFKLLIILTTHQQILHIQINKEFKIDIIQSTQIRYPQNDTMGICVYVDEKILVLHYAFFGNRFYYYYLNADQEFLDYIYLSNKFQISKFNTTHYLIFGDYDIGIGTFGYTIDIDSNKNLTQGLTLVAENKISKAEITLLFTKQPEQLNITIYIQIATLFLIVLYIKIKQSQQKR